MDIEFISYTGKYPNLCFGILTLKIDGELISFGNGFLSSEQGVYQRFWIPGGCAYWTDDYANAHLERGAWMYDGDLPKEYEPYADQLMEVFNANVPFGCCGGCL